MYIVSRCLLGFDCKYNGGNNKNDDVIEFCKTHDYVTICPETAAGLSVPREPAEIVPIDDEYFKVLDKKRSHKSIRRRSAAFAEFGARGARIEKARHM